jgi:hypothetical protein
MKGNGFAAWVVAPHVARLNSASVSNDTVEQPALAYPRPYL